VDGVEVEPGDPVPGVTTFRVEGAW
jgi:hypothetical protein